ncbi:hypothetical protein [Staphylococcus agnetis]|uniref:hypothetical protein n=1 Tax=Staphylococcus agnetis TaxID=985762 RepID=UPI00208F5922|nr:hypothetical protein [Staphylococcus agnetis]MCO4338430.1 hypothetical protein [Staphylococcus agnetis]MCO4347478.1 hypothetical protein [Staphylococcus agnetis]
MEQIKQNHQRALKIIELAEKEKWSEEELISTIDLLHLQTKDYLPIPNLKRAHELYKQGTRRMIDSMNYKEDNK